MQGVRAAWQSGCHGVGVSGVALEHLHRHRTALGIAQEAEDNLPSYRDMTIAKSSRRF
jgi:hypothetical protein